MALFPRQMDQPDKSPHAIQQITTCPAFSALYEEFSDERKYRILDLGEVSGANVAFFSELKCKLFVGGDVIASVLSYQKSLAEEEPPKVSVQDMLGLGEVSDLDLLMCWDVFNYLEPRLIKPFSTSLRQMMAEGAFLHTFIYTHQKMPAEPGAYQILNSGQMNVEHPSDFQDLAPLYTQRALESYMPGFAVKQSRLLQSGVQEYLFRAV